MTKNKVKRQALAWYSLESMMLAAEPATGFAPMVISALAFRTDSASCSGGGVMYGESIR